MRFVAIARVVVDVDLAAVVGPGLTVDSDLVAREASISLATLLGDRLIEVTEIRAPVRDVGWVRRRGRLKGQVAAVYGVADGRVCYGYRGRGRGPIHFAPVAWWHDNFSLEAIGGDPRGGIARDGRASPRRRRGRPSSARDRPPRPWPPRP